MINLHRSLLYLFCCFSTALFSQSEITVNTSVQQVGKRLDQDGTIDARVHIFPEIITSLQVDSISNVAGVRLLEAPNALNDEEETDIHVQYDLSRQAVKWSKPIFNPSRQYIENWLGIPFEHRGNRSFKLSDVDGQQIQKMKSDFVFADANRMLALGYHPNPVQFEDRNHLVAYDISTGEEVWDRYLYQGVGWNEAYYISDTTLLISSQGVHTLNITNGRGWSYQGETTRPTNPYNKVTHGAPVFHLNSEILRDTANNCLFYADINYLTRLSENGDVIWESDLVDGQASKSKLILRNDTISVVNYGAATFGYQDINFGTPYIATYNAKTGIPISIKVLAQHRKDIIKDVVQKGDTLYLAFLNKVITFSLSSNEVLQEETFDPELYGDLVGFADSWGYTYENEELKSFNDSYPNKVFLISKTAVFALNNNLSTARKYSYEEIRLQYQRYKGFSFVGNLSQSHIISPEGKVVALLDAPMGSVVIKNTLFYIKGNSLIEVPLSEIIK